jgi:hypothetical protein
MIRIGRAVMTIGILIDDFKRAGQFEYPCRIIVDSSFLRDADAIDLLSYLDRAAM